MIFMMRLTYIHKALVQVFDEQGVRFLHRVDGMMVREDRHAELYKLRRAGATT